MRSVEAFGQGIQINVSLTSLWETECETVSKQTKVESASTKKTQVYINFSLRRKKFKKVKNSQKVENAYGKRAPYMNRERE